MSAISQAAGLSRVYTNHCIRATCVTVLDDAGIEARHIMRITGHKNEASIRSYSCRLSDAKKRSISETISETVLPKAQTSDRVPKKKATLTRPPSDQEQFDSDTDAILSQVIIPHPSTSAAPATLNCSQTRTSTFQFHNCQVNININK